MKANSQNRAVCAQGRLARTPLTPSGLVCLLHQPRRACSPTTASKLPCSR